MNLATIYLHSAISRFKEEKALGDKSFHQLSEEDLHYQINATSNSIAIIVQHLHGNMLSRWTNFLTEDGEKEWRRRDEEFELFSGTKADLLRQWEDGWKVLLDTLESLSEEDLLRTIHIRNQSLSVVDAINRQLAHYSYHVGQIVYISKLIRGDDWQTLSIPKGASADYNKTLMK